MSAASTLTGQSGTAEFSLAWGRMTSGVFNESVVDVCKELGWTPEQASHLMACMAFETARTFSPKVRNAAGSGAVGLIQFMPKTAKSLGTSSEALMQMAAHEQLEYVKKYFWPYRQRITTLPDMYMAILMPKYIGSPMSAVLFQQPGIAYRQNSGLDHDDDGRITKLEASRSVLRLLELGRKNATKVLW